ncbi:DNA-binding MarR family transcriptional regulator [Paraburkholderia tropica]|uniref:MarR family winged helix-turn-helix transcriptional regulator n=1 Tax=Paraburkholderia TaxID=1822464 RepID=UPI001CAD7870|nr:MULTISPECIES: MarR family transcriptional regulator [Paraburkholderia]CAG9206051.1 DNA-binding MarR family transcriptional regulator [Paraburkholderia tropica]
MPYSLTEMRILRELASGGADTAAALARNLTLDSGYLSRILTGFEQRDLLAREPSKADARQTLLRLTHAGQAAYAALAAAAVGNIESVLARLTTDEQARLVDAMRVVQQLLS